jgi:glutamine amidotransferase
MAVCVGGGSWKVHRSITSADDDRQFEEAAATANGEVLLAHVREKTVGRVRVVNTHPFRRERWVFAHNGTIEGLDFFRRRSSTRRIQQVEGETDSELFFTYLLSCLDVAGEEREAIDTALACAVQEVVANAPRGGYTFLLSDGSTLYAYRRGRPLFLLERGNGDTRAQDLPHGAAALIASTPLTTEAWRPLTDGDLVRVTREGGLAIRMLFGNALTSAVDSGPELPFTV